MPQSTRSHSAEFKFKVVLEVLKGEKTMNQIADENKLIPAQLSQWKKAFLENGSTVFGKSEESRHKVADFEKEKARMERKIGELTLCVDFLKKNLPSLGFRLLDLSIALDRKRQCELLGINRQSTYRSVKLKFIDPTLMAIVDRAFTDFPAFGPRGLAKVIR